MFKAEIKKEYRDLYLYCKQLDERMVKIKTSLHTLEKLGINVDGMYKELDDLGIELYKTKQMLIDSFKEFKEEIK